MKTKLLTAVALGAMLVWAGCASPPMAPTTVAVRFAPFPDMEMFGDTSTGMHADADLPHSHDDPNFIAVSSASNMGDAFTVALWGGQYYGDDVTMNDASLDPGHYTFGFWNHDDATALKGWVEVNFAGTELVDTLREWKDRIPEQKQWLAYDFEIKGKLDTTDSKVFASFAKQLRAFDKLEREIDEAIMQETRMQEQRQRRVHEVLSDSVVLMLPTGSGIFHPTTQPVFAPEDVTRAKSGDAVTKVLLVADARGTRKKLRNVDQVCRSLQGCRNVLTEEVDRLERQKRYFVTTDHIYNHDRKFVENEMRMQQALNGIDQLTEQIADMRERRLALSFTNGLVSPDRLMDPLDAEQRDLDQQRTVLSSQKHRLDMMFNETAEDSPRRIVFQRQRMRVNRAIEDIDRYGESVTEARVALSTMRDTTRVIHRQGDTRLLAATFLDPVVPSRVREAVEHDAFMIVRIESTPTGADPLHVQETTTVTTASYVEPCDP